MTTESTTPQAKCQLALSLLNHRVHDARLVELVAAVMRGVTLGDVVDTEPTK